ncbi:MAG: type II secretion system protein [Hydrogenibacillus schlegelii]|uniref:Type II secretion system protein n=1 Tax=Hydrogenibacillus schlegelii TaxID=1484 RepID=A0A2T5G7T1_HYDSH|nr:type II secretion system F family protein [Hydrogenibacillus schlegelii]PTQ52232.1 MAG: type II secretion system protein [Hydrogenibacillus schlegelii]
MIDLAAFFLAASGLILFFALRGGEGYAVFRRRIDPIATARAVWNREENVRYVAASIGFYFFARVFAGGITPLIFTAIFFVFLKFFWSRISFLFRRSKLRKAMLRDMDGLINSLVSALQAGYGFLAALRATRPFVPEPLRSEITRIVERVETGKMSLEESLFLFHEQYKLPETRRFAYTLSFAARFSGRDLVPVLKAMAQTFRMIYQTQEKLNARTTQIRIALLILPISPLVMLLLLNAVMPDAVRLLLTDGRMILFVGLSVVAAAILWALNMLARFSELE